MEIAIFGGSFDPVHIAHEEIVKKALEQLRIDKLIVVPAYLNPFKKKFYLEPKLRFSLLKKVFCDYDKVEISDYEILQKKPVFSFNTINYLKNKYCPNKIYFIIGQDNVRDLDKWYKIEEIKKEVEFVVASRDKNNSLYNYKILDIDINISSTKLRKKMNLNYVPLEIKEDMKKINLKGKN